MVKIAIIEYGVGNLRSISNGLKKVKAEIILTHDKSEMESSDALVLPGVGAFKGAIDKLTPISGIVLDQISQGKPLLGICLGLQLLFTISTEGGIYKGLDIYKGKVVKLPDTVKVPHMGWNTLEFLKTDNPLLNGIKKGSYVYFVHSYYGDVENEDDIVANTNYGVKFPSILANKQVFSTQFHPEKSGNIGLKMLENFIDFVKT
ncbi:MAG: imidazole glycerol phosphate synthase subunit HisH [Candidatus Helarchaeota archaeon]